MIIKQKVEAIAIIAKMDNGKYYQINTLKDNKVQILNYLAALTKSCTLELLDNELESIEF